MIYLDHNATSPASQEHLSQVLTLYQASMGNPSSPHAMGRNASVALTQARRAVAQALGVDVSQLIFTSGATEADNMATRGVLEILAKKGTHALVSAFEHPAVGEPVEVCQRKLGFSLTKLNPNAQGFLQIQDIISNINENTNYISVMAANNEVGTLQPVGLLGDFLHYKRWGTLSSQYQENILALEPFLSSVVTKEQLQKLHFHVDGVQSFGKLKLERWFSAGIDSCAISAHKLGGLSGVGALFLRRGRVCEPLAFGGAQEKNRRAGTENLMGILSFGLICQEMMRETWWDKVAQMDEKRRFLFQALEKNESVILNSSLENSLPNTVHFSVRQGQRQKNGEDLLLELDLKGICASSGSACSSGANLSSHVLLSMGRTTAEAKNAVRLSFGPHISWEEIQATLSTLNDLLP
jgi:cysteine desulfurase